MADEASAGMADPAPAPAAEKKLKKKVGNFINEPASKKPSKPAEHPKYSEMLAAAITNLKERGGSSRQAILKYIMSHYKVNKDPAVVNSHLKMALRAGVKNGKLQQKKGTGASGSFRLASPAEKKDVGKKAASPKKKPAKPKAKKPATKKPKSPKKAKAAKPKVKAKKPAAKKPKAKTTKPKKAKSPKKAAKPKAKKAAKKAAKK